MIERRTSPYEEPIDPVIRTNLDMVDSHFRDEANNNIEGVLNSYTDEITWTAFIREGGPLVVKGKAAAADNYHSIFDGLENIKFEPLLRSATREYVFDRTTVRFTVIGKDHFSGLSVGQQGELILYHIFKMQDGKICEEQVYEIPPDTVYEEIWKPSTSQ